MLPIFRIISVGGVSLAISILALALIPPGGTRLLLTPHDKMASGAMIDPRQHPEWRQFMIQAALRRADEIERLRSLPSEPVRLPDVVVPLEEPITAVVPPAAPQADQAVQPAATVQPDQAVAGLQSGGQPAAAEDITGSINDNPGATIPIDIGEASSTELPVGPAEEKPPVSGVQDSRIPEPEVALPSTTPVVETRETVLPRARPKMRVIQQRRPRHKKVARPSKPRAAAPQAAAPQAPPPFNLLSALFGGSGQTPQATAENSRAAATESSPGNRPVPAKRRAAAR